MIPSEIGSSGQISVPSIVASGVILLLGIVCMVVLNRVMMFFVVRLLKGVRKV